MAIPLKANFITAQYLIKKGLVDANVDVSLLTPNITYAQDTHMQIILGYQLYQSLMDQQVAVDGGGSWNGQQYQDLIEGFVQPALMWWSIYESMDFIQYKLTNKTVAQQTSDHSQAASDNAVDRLKAAVTDRAEFYTQRIREQIANNVASYPEYFTQVGVERIVSHRTEYNGGFGLPRNPKRRPGAGGNVGCCAGDGVGIPLN